jgi:ATP-dependent helicase/nuclease subunit A
MTVHGAKGLEAPIVVLADTTTPPAGPAQYQPRLLPVPAQNAAPGTPGRFVWMPLKKDDTPPVGAARMAWIADQENEYRRLLYVAMTRAADRLVVCGAIGERPMPPGCWYQLISRGLEVSGQLTEERADFGEGTVHRYRKSELDGIIPSGAGGTEQSPATPQPGWLITKAPPSPVHAEPITPSSFADIAHGRDSRQRRHAIKRGSVVHRLMQALPEIPSGRHADAAQRFLARHGDDFDETERTGILARLLAMLDDPGFAALFAPGSRAEVPIVGHVGDQFVSGIVDRLVVTPDAVEIVDYKTNRPAPSKLDETLTRHPGYVRQLALYRAVLARLYPGRPVRCALLWTDLPALQEIPAEALDEALATLPRP